MVIVAMCHMALHYLGHKVLLKSFVFKKNNPNLFWLDNSHQIALEQQPIGKYWSLFTAEL